MAGRGSIWLGLGPESLSAVNDSIAGEPFGLLRQALESAGVRFAVGGSWASAAYGEARFTNDIDILADFTTDFYVDPDESRSYFIYMPSALKFDLFPARAFPPSS